MYKVAIAEDEGIVRSALSALIRQYLNDFQVCGEFQNGALALEYLKKETVHLLITDIKMPVMDGIELIDQVMQLPVKPIILIISAYNDFQLVRDGFRLGAFDYILKVNIDKDYILKLGENIRPKLKETFPHVTEGDNGQNYEQWEYNQIIAEDKALPADFWKKPYFSVAVIEIDTTSKLKTRFSSRQDILTLGENIIQVLGQIPRIARNGTVFYIKMNQYGMIYQVSEQKISEPAEVCAQIIRVLKTYLNIQVTVGVSSLAQAGGSVKASYEEAVQNLMLKHILSHGKVYISDGNERIDRNVLSGGRETYSEIISALGAADAALFTSQRSDVFSNWRKLSFEQLKQEALSLICQIAGMLEENDDNIIFVFNLDVNYFDKLSKLQTAIDVEMWMTNFMSWIFDYIKTKHCASQINVIDKAKQFINDFHSDPTISLGAVADYVGLNENYFSTRFPKETGSTFISYLTEIRMAKAKELLTSTDLKIYEISEKVGYVSTEHFMRMFKKTCGVSPNAFRKKF